MRVEGRLDKGTRIKLNTLRGAKKKKKHKNPKKHQEKFTDKYIEDLMGVNMPTYKRCRGAYRQK